VDLRSLAPPHRTGVYRGPALCRVAGISYRQLDYWARTGLLNPSISSAKGSGSQRLYSRSDLVLALAIRRLLGLGVSLQNIRELTDPGSPGDPVGLREAISRGRKRWSATVTVGGIGAAGIWIDLGSIRKWLAEEEAASSSRASPPAA